VNDLAIRALHDATVDAAVARFVEGRRVVGVMGGHALARDAALYRVISELGRELTRRGLTVATGGGPGVMEAANLGAWFAPFDDRDLDEALVILAEAPTYAADPAMYVGHTLEVRRRWPRGGVSLGVPTWVYADEPTSGFASHIAKYFTNSVREDGLLAIARSGVVYAPGGAGTEEEIFTDTAQNSLTLYEVRSPMVFLGRRHFEVEHGELVTAARRQATTFGWRDLITVCDDPSEAVAFILEHDPDAAGTAGVERRRTHRGPGR
jgi:predicted Rossmann-fold nucleotide-binding protein